MPRGVAPAVLAAGALLLLAPSAAAASLDALDDGGNYRFQPFDLTAKPGEQVTLRDAGQEAHTMTSADGAWPAITVQPGGSAGLAAPAAPGDYRFYCAYHAGPGTPPGQGMAGTLHVASAGSAGSGAPGPNGSAPPGKGTPGPGPLGLLGALALGARLRRRP